MKRHLATFYFLIMLTFVSSLHASINELKLTPEDLPEGWKIENEYEVPTANLVELSNRLGGEITVLLNQFIDADGIALQINYMESSSETDAVRIHEILTGMIGSKDFSCRVGKVVIEFVTQHLSLASYVRHLLGFGRRDWVEYDVRLRIAPIEECNDSLSSELFHLLLEYERNPSDDLKGEIERIKKEFVFGNRLRLWTGERDYFKATYEMTPEPIHSEEFDGITTYYFENLPEILGIPFVEVKALIQIRECYTPTGEVKDADYAHLCADTRDWPADSQSLWKLVTEILGDAEDSQKRASRLVKWVWREIAYSGPMGSRHGVEKTLRQRYGRCWDKSDLFITFTRIAGIPSRQIAGWLYGTSSHVWSEIYIEGKGWLPVDSTTPWLGTSSDYIPFFSTDTGKMHFLYVSMPEIIKRNNRTPHERE